MQPSKHPPTSPIKIAQQRQVTRYNNEQLEVTSDCVAAETAIALVYNGLSHVVMMASPQDLLDFGLGFSLSEGIINQASDIQAMEILHQPLGIELHIKIHSRLMWALKQQRRNLTGRTGCGLCGAESLAQAMPSLANQAKPKQIISDATHIAIQKALLNLEHHQPVQQLTGAMHGAAWCDNLGNIQVIREDIGRHNALDKLIGGLNQQDFIMPVNQQEQGFVMISSRASYEMITKIHAAKINLLVAVSAPTTLAITLAEQLGVTLVGFARNKRHTVYTAEGL